MGRIIGMSDVPRIGEQVIFLTGPNRGAPISWRREAANRMIRSTSAGIAFTDFSQKSIHPEFKSHIEWGIYHRNWAMNTGLVMFWFPKQDARIPGPRMIDHDHTYGANAMYDLGRCIGECFHRPMTKICVGCEPAYAKKQMLSDRLRLEGVGTSLFEGEMEAFCDQALVVLGKRKN